MPDTACGDKENLAQIFDFKIPHLLYLVSEIIIIGMSSLLLPVLKL